VEAAHGVVLCRSAVIAETGPNEMSEMALAHTVSDKVEAAYRYCDMREKRRRTMAEWAVYRARSVAGHGQRQLKVKRLC